MRKNYPDVGEADFALELQSLVRIVVRIEKKVKDFHIWHVQKDNRVYFRKCDLVASKQEVDSDWALNVLRGVIDINGKIKEPKPKAGRLIRR